MSSTGTVKKWMEDKGFGFILPEGGGDDIFIHKNQLVDCEVLHEGDAVAFDKEYNERQGKYKASNCTVTSSAGGAGGCGGDSWGGCAYGGNVGGVGYDGGAYGGAPAYGGADGGYGGYAGGKGDGRYDPYATGKGWP